MARGRVDDAGGLHLIFHATILMEIPVGGIFVVADGGDRGDHEAAGAADLGALVAHVVMLPGEAGILLMQADALFDGARIAEHVGNDRIEIVNIAETVAAERQ